MCEAGWESTLPVYSSKDAALATRQSSQQVLAKVRACDV
jgi:hypothetical protein